MEFPSIDPKLLVVLASIAIGFIGSLAYITALYFAFIGGTTRKERQFILRPFCGDDEQLRLWKVVWYCSIGGLISSVFQFPEDTFVPIQAFILGATWPSIVSQLLSGRQMGLSEGEREELKKEMKSLKEKETPLSWEADLKTLKESINSLAKKEIPKPKNHKNKTPRK